MGQQHRQRGQHLRCRRVLVVQRQVMVQHGREAGRDVDRLVEGGRIGPGLPEAQGEETCGRDGQHR